MIFMYQNQLAIDKLIEDYDVAIKLKNLDREHGFNNAINALRIQELFINDINTAITIKFFDDFFSKYIVDASNSIEPEGLVEMKQLLAILEHNHK